MRSVFSIIAALMVFASCQNTTGELDHQAALEDFKQMEGTWQLQPDAANYESWSVNQVGLAGSTYSVSKNDTSILQVNTVEVVNDTLTYSATLLMGALTETINYKLTGRKKNKFIFENPEREFPKKITFNFVGDATLNELREGDISGMYQSMDIKYKKVD